MLNESNRKLNKIWVDKGSQLYNRSMKSLLHNNNIEIYSTLNEERYVNTERFIRTLHNKIYRYVTSVSKNVYFDLLYDIVNKHNNAYHSIIKTKSANELQYIYWV